MSLEHDQPDPDAALVPIFDIKDGAVLPLAEIALETAGIEYAVRAPNMLIPGVTKGTGTEHTGFDRQVPGQILVRAEDAARARELLTDLEQAPAPNSAANEPTPTEWDKPAAPASNDSE